MCKSVPVWYPPGPHDRDRADTDILLGKNCGLRLSHESDLEFNGKCSAWEGSQDSEEQRMVPEKFIDKLGDLRQNNFLWTLTYV